MISPTQTRTHTHKHKNTHNHNTAHTNTDTHTRYYAHSHALTQKIMHKPEPRTVAMHPLVKVYVIISVLGVHGKALVLSLA